MLGSMRIFRTNPRGSQAVPLRVGVGWQHSFLFTHSIVCNRSVFPLTSICGPLNQCQGLSCRGQSWAPVNSASNKACREQVIPLAVSWVFSLYLESHSLVSLHALASLSQQLGWTQFRSKSGWCPIYSWVKETTGCFVVVLHFDLGDSTAKMWALKKTYFEIIFIKVTNIFHQFNLQHFITFASCSSVHTHPHTHTFSTMFMEIVTTTLSMNCKFPTPQYTYVFIPSLQTFWSLHMYACMVFLRHLQLGMSCSFILWPFGVYYPRKECVSFNCSTVKNFRKFTKFNIAISSIIPIIALWQSLWPAGA